MTPQQIADAYFAAMRAQDLPALLTLFAEDATIRWPDGSAVTGREAIRAAYQRLFAQPSNNPRPGPVMAGAASFATEVRSRLIDGSERRTINVFRLADDGRVAAMTSYRNG